MWTLRDFIIKVLKTLSTLTILVPESTAYVMIARRSSNMFHPSLDKPLLIKFGYVYSKFKKIT